MILFISKIWESFTHKKYTQETKVKLNQVC